MCVDGVPYFCSKKCWYWHEWSVFLHIPHSLLHSSCVFVNLNLRTSTHSVVFPLKKNSASHFKRDVIEKGFVFFKILIFHKCIRLFIFLVSNWSVTSEWSAMQMLTISVDMATISITIRSFCKLPMYLSMCMAIRIHWHGPLRPVNVVFFVHFLKRTLRINH